MQEVAALNGDVAISVGALILAIVIVVYGAAKEWEIDVSDGAMVFAGMVLWGFLFTALKLLVLPPIQTALLALIILTGLWLIVLSVMLGKWIKSHRSNNEDTAR